MTRRSRNLTLRATLLYLTAPKAVRLRRKPRESKETVNLPLINALLRK
jgi:hypothetical protein